MDNSVLLERVKNKEKQLKEAANSLKLHFVGLDDIIDKIVDNIKTWWCMPELITRPVIVCLFGPTGVGKTDLVRRLVKLLDFSDKFCEIELANKNSSWQRSAAGVLRESNRIESGKPSIILLDEIQNFRTLDEDGNEIQDYELKDVWSLLSDGKLPYKVEMESLLSMLWDYNKKDQQKKADSISNNTDLILMIKKAKREINKVRRGKGPFRKSKKRKMLPAIEFQNEDENTSYYQLTYLKSVLRLDNPIEEIALWSDDKKKQMIIQRLNDKSIYEEEDYTKSLIFISGNIDEAYGFTKNAKEVDIEADILYEKAKRVSILDIKEALGKRFRPEQISRMGNVHVIYPTLSKKSFEVIINRKVDSIIQNVKKQTDIELVVDSSLNKLIYDNGVYPTQGTRPVFSTISEVLESFLPEFLLTAMIKNSDKLIMSYDGKNVVGTVNENTLCKPFVGNLDVLREKKSKNYNRKTLSAVHEAAHAIVHAVLFKVSPSQIVASPVDSEMDGFVYSQECCFSKQAIRNRVCVLLAGQEAEKIVFGEVNCTAGSADDLRKATSFVASMIRRWGMDKWGSQIYDKENNDLAFNDVDSSNKSIEDIIKKLRAECKDIILNYKGLLIEVVDLLIKQDKIVPEEFKKICYDHDVNITVSALSDDMTYWDYYNRFEEYKKE